MLAILFNGGPSLSSGRSGRVWVAGMMLALFVFAQLCHLSRHSALASGPQSVVHFDNTTVSADHAEACLLCLLMRGTDLVYPAVLRSAPLQVSMLVCEPVRFSWPAIVLPGYSVRGPPASSLS